MRERQRNGVLLSKAERSGGENDEANDERGKQTRLVKLVKGVPLLSPLFL